MDNDSKMIFEKYVLLKEQELATLIGAEGGGEGGNWGGSLPKLISLLPMGQWNPSSLKRTKRDTKSGFMSDHYEGNKIAYAADFGLKSTFNGDADAATDFAIKVARNAGKDISSWEPFVGKSLKHNTPDGFRIQIIWQSNVGGNHYDHVHVGVKKGSGGIDTMDDEIQDADLTDQSQAEPQGDYADQLLAQMKKQALGILGGTQGFSAQGAKEALKSVTGAALGAIAPQIGSKLTK